MVERMSPFITSSGSSDGGMLRTAPAVPSGSSSQW